MTATRLPSTGAAAAQNELLAQLGLPPAASPEDVDDLHLAASRYLAAAPAELRGWAHAQAAALDRAYLTLTDPVGLQGSALRSPARPPTVVPGGPATPPARRGSTPEAATDDAPAGADEPDELEAVDETDEPDLADFEALYASVTPSAHEDMGASTRRAKASRPATPVAAAKAGIATPKAPSNPWKKVAIGAIAIVAVIGIAVGGYTLGGNATTADPGASPGAAQASNAAPAVDEAKVAGLMAKYQADPKDITTLMALANEFYAGGEYDTAATWLDKTLAIDPENIEALLAKGAVAFNEGDLTGAETSWNVVVGIDPTNVEAHYDLGFLYLNQQTPDWAGVQREWSEVVKLDPTSDLAKTVQAHLESLASASMLPASSPTASGEPAPSLTPSPAASAAASTQP